MSSDFYSRMEQTVKFKWRRMSDGSLGCVETVKFRKQLERAINYLMGDFEELNRFQDLKFFAYIGTEIVPDGGGDIKTGSGLDAVREFIGNPANFNYYSFWNGEIVDVEISTHDQYGFYVRMVGSQSKRTSLTLICINPGDKVCNIEPQVVESLNEVAPEMAREIVSTYKLAGKPIKDLKDGDIDAMNEVLGKVGYRLVRHQSHNPPLDEAFDFS